MKRLVTPDQVDGRVFSNVAPEEIVARCVNGVVLPIELDPFGLCGLGEYPMWTIVDGYRVLLMNDHNTNVGVAGMLIFFIN